MMATTQRTIIGALATLPLLLICTGCEDAQATAQREAAARFDQALAASQKALPGGFAPATAEEAQTAADALRRIVHSVSSPAGGTPSQRSSLLLLASNLNRKAAELDLAVAAVRESEHRLERLAVARAAAAAADLEALAVPLDRIDFASARTQLKTVRDQAEGQLRQLQSQMRAIESAIAQVDRQLALTEAEAKRLEMEAEHLRSQALALRPRQALPYIEQAAALSIRNADLRGTLGRQQSERAALAPQLAGAQALSTGGAAMLEVSDGAIRNLQDLSEQAREAAARARRGASEIRGGAKSRMEAMLAAIAGDLDARYEAAIGGFERSASLAQQAGSGVDAMSGDSARLAQAMAQISLAQALVLRGGSLADQAALLRQLDRLGGWGESSQLSPAASRAEEQAREAIARAREQFGAAIQTLEMLRTPALAQSGDVAGLKDRAAAALARLEGAAGGSLDSAAAPGTAGASGSGDGGAPSAQALVEWINAAGESAAAARRASGIYHSSNAQLVAALRAMSSAMEPVLAASERAFGTMLDIAAPGGMGMGTPQGARLLSADDERATVEISTPMGPQTVTAVRIDGAWFLDFDSMLDAMMPGQGAMMAAQMAPMLTLMSRSMREAATAFAARIDAGEFPSADEAAAAFMQELQKAMSGGVGGMSGF